ncbi:hypothetical protein EV714DRAFT_273627 [Schizophyllum commune]
MAAIDDCRMPRVLRPQQSASTLGASLQTLCAASLSALPLYTPALLLDPRKLDASKRLSCLTAWDDCSDTETMVEPNSACSSSTSSTSLSGTLDTQLRDSPLDAFADVCWGGSVQRGLGWEWWDDDEDQVEVDPHDHEQCDDTSPPPYSPSATDAEVSMLRAAHEAALRARFRRAWVPEDDDTPTSPFEEFNPPLSVRTEGEGVGRSPTPAGYARSKTEKDSGSAKHSVPRLRMNFLELLRTRKRTLTAAASPTSAC